MKIDKKLKDEEVLEKSFDNPKYFEIIVNRYQKAFIKRSFSILNSREEAEDVVQDTFLKIYKYGNKFREVKGASFKSWAYEILQNTAYSQYKKDKKRLLNIKMVDFSLYDVEDKGISGIERMESKEKLSYVESIISLMPETLANILRLRFLENKSQKEIAKIENISKEAVRVRIHRAKNLFRTMLTNNI